MTCEEFTNPGTCEELAVGTAFVSSPFGLGVKRVCALHGLLYSLVGTVVQLDSRCEHRELGEEECGKLAFHQSPIVSRKGRGGARVLLCPEHAEMYRRWEYIVELIRG